MAGLKPKWYKIKDSKNPSINKISEIMRKIKNFLKSEDGDVIMGAVGMALFFLAFYKIMWIASAVGILN